MRPILLFCLLWVSWLSFGATASAQSFLKRVEQASPTERIQLTMNYFDTSQVILTSRANALRLLADLNTLGQRQQDEQLRAYSQFIRKTYAKNDPKLTNAQKAELFLRVAEQAGSQPTERLAVAAVSTHFAGMYFFLSEEYSKAFAHLLAANETFKRIGYSQVPCISRYLNDLAYAYYYLHEDDQVVALLTEAAKHTPFNNNRHIQTYNTLGLAYLRLAETQPDPHFRRAEQAFQKTRQVAVNYGDSLWVGYAFGNLGNLYKARNQWTKALAAYRIDYRLGMQFGEGHGYPDNTACNMALAFGHLGQWDSCRYYLDESARLYRENNYSFNQPSTVAEDNYRRVYYEVYKDYHQANGNLSEANRYADSVLVYQARIDRRFRSKAAILAEQRQLVQQHQAEVQRTQTQRLLLGIGVAVAVLVAGLLGFLYRSSQRRRQQEAIAHTERQQRLEGEKQQATAERDHARAELNQFLDRLRYAETHHDLTQNNLLTNDDWDEFRRRFEHVHPAFFQQLRTQFADLTPAEERLLALSKLEIDSLRMSRMLGISQESIRKSKYRMRKKFGLDGTSSLSDLLQ